MTQFLVWEPSTGQQVSFEYKIPASGEYVTVLHPLKDDGISFNVEIQFSTPLNLTMPTTVILALGIVIVIFL